MRPRHFSRGSTGRIPARRRVLSLLLVVGVLAVTAGVSRTPLDLPGPCGTWVETLQPDEATGGPGPADKAQADAGADLVPAVLASVGGAPLVPICVTLPGSAVDRGPPGHPRGLDHPPRSLV